MFTFFHNHKFFSNKKGQIIPVFIIVIVIIIIMVLVTVNIGKVALTKTDTANSADSGALAGSSALASLFNNVAVANSFMDVSFWEFFLDSSVMLTINLTTLAIAQTKATIGMAKCLAGLALMTNPLTFPAGLALYIAGCAMIVAAAGLMGAVIAGIAGMIAATTAFSIAQQFFYMSIRKMADEGWKSSVRIGHQLSFKNSGTNSKLRSAPLGDILYDPNFNFSQFSNYQESFAWFMKFFVKHQTTIPYAWLDGQQRHHVVTSTVIIDKVDKFALKISTMPLPAELGMLGGAMGLAIAATMQLLIVPMPAGVPTALATMIPIYVLLPTAFAGLIPGPIFPSSSSGDSSMFIIDCIQDIIHNRLVTAIATQNHAGEDMGLWTTRYPDRAGLVPISSFSVGRISNGSIYPFMPTFDSALIFTDVSIPVEFVPETDNPFGKVVDSAKRMAKQTFLCNEAFAAPEGASVQAELTCRRAADAVKRLEEKLAIYSHAARSLKEAADQTAFGAEEMEKYVGGLQDKYKENVLLKDKELKKDSEQKYGDLKDKISAQSYKITKAANDLWDASEVQANEAAAIEQQIERIKAANPGCSFD